MTVYCVDCKAAFEVGEGEEWKVRCLRCFRRHARGREHRERETWQDRRPESPVDAFERQIRRAALDLYAQARKGDERELELRFQAGRAEGWKAGYTEGFDAGAAGSHALDAGFLRDLVALCHPDRHPGRVDKATRATQRLNGLLEHKTTRRAA